ncbi:MAG: NAD(+)/NADH kinase [bacterium]|nr:NAD(+)/NADH kinase [bacterium]
MRIGFAANPLKEGALQTRDSLLRLTAERGIGHVLITDAAALLQEPHPVDILVVVGGDGSLLRYADAASSLKIPLLGVNLGRIGFLSELSEQAFPDALDRLLEGAYTIERRMMLRCTINEEAPLYCLNDIVVFKRTFSGVTEVNIQINGAEVGTVFCDGVIAATPTGSTAYSLSAGGSILADGLDAISVTTVCPHTLHIRPIVTAADADIRFSVADSGIVSVDGMRIHEVHRGDSIRVTGASRTTDFIRFGKSDLFRLIHEKLS